MAALEQKLVGRKFEHSAVLREGPPSACVASPWGALVGSGPHPAALASGRRTAEAGTRYWPTPARWPPTQACAAVSASLGRV